MDYFNNRWFGGMSEDEFNGGDDKVLYSENINLTSNTEYIELNSKPALYYATGTKVPRQIVKVKDTSSNQNYIITFCNDGVVYNEEGLVYTNTDLGNGEYPVFVMGDYLYFTTIVGGNYILNRTTITDAISNSWSPTTGYKTMSATDGYEYTGAIVSQQVAFIWVGSKINRIDLLGTLTEFDLTGGKEIVGMTIMPSYYKIYTETGEVLLWNGESTGTEKGCDFNFPLRKAFNVNSLDYVISGDLDGGTGLYYMNGLTPVLLTKMRFSNFLGINKYDIQYNPTNNAGYFDMSFLIDDEGDRMKILQFGHDLQGLPNGFNYLVGKNSYGNDITTINAICYSGNEIFYGYNDGTNKGVDSVKIIPGGTRQTTGTIITTRQSFGNALLNKTYNQLFLRVENITATQYIQVYLSTNGGAFSLISTINSQPTDGIVKIPIIGDFRDYSIKLVLNSDGVSPRVFLPYKLSYEVKGI